MTTATRKLTAAEAKPKNTEDKRMKNINTKL